MNIVINPLCPALLPDYLDFFDNISFTENPHWSQCYCYSFHFTGPDEEWERAKNRLAVSDMIKQGKMKGYLAFSNGSPVGWCNVNDRDYYQRLKKHYTIEEDPDLRILSIVCFLIRPDFRGNGIAKMILDKIIEDHSGSDYDFIEAYPSKLESSCEKNYKGPLSMYEKHDFRIINKTESYLVVRRKL